MPRHPSTSRRGSALIIVLGILAVMLLMAVAFSTFVRTERGGSTNLKNSFVARSSLDTALGRVMEAIDHACGVATNDDPVPVWPHPWIASAEGGYRYQSEILGDKETAGAHVLTAKIADYLSPAQLALARAAKCNWAPVYSSINASKATSNAGADYGRPEEDSLVGRYAFIALDTTGLVDMNNAGGGSAAERKADSGSDPLCFQFPANDGKDTDGVTVPRFLKTPSTFLSKRNSSKLFYSLADARTEASAAFDESTVPEAKEEYYPADLISGFAPSLEELDPEGRPKIGLPTRAQVEKYNPRAFKALARRTYRAMVAIFARSRVEAGQGAADVSKDTMKIFQSTGAQYDLSRSALAATALLDSLDADSIPGQSVNPSVNYWSSFPDTTVRVNGTTVSETPPDASSPLNFPCTESAALLSGVYAYVEFDGSTYYGNASQNLATAYREWSGTLTIGALAICQNRSADSSGHSATLKIEYEVMEGTADNGTVSGGNATDIRDDYLELPDPNQSGRTPPKVIDWSDLFDNKSGSETSAAEDLNDANDGKRTVRVETEIPFTVKCYAQSATTYYPITAAEYKVNNAGEDISDVFLPIRIKATITETRDGRSGTAQQVPAPALEALESKAYWIRINPGVYHNPDSSDFQGGTGEGSAGDLSCGWAHCACLPFGFDTTSLIASDGNYMNFWVNDEVVRPSGGGRIGAATSAKFGGLYDKLFADSGAKDEVIGGFSGRGSTVIWNYLQTDWLFNDDEDYSHVTDYLDYDGRVPDMLHSSSKGGTPFVAAQQGGVSPGNLARELYSRFPSDGFSSVADLGTVMCGPYETLSLFKTWRYSSEADKRVADFHPVLDYFTMGQDRYPSRTEVVSATDSSGEVDWTELSGSSSSNYKDLYSGMHGARVNLNAPPLVECVKVADGVGVRGDASDYLNPYPIATVLNGAPYPVSSGTGNTIQTNAISEGNALTLATDLCRMLEDATSAEMRIKARRECFGTNTTRKVVRNLSFLGMGNGDENPFLADFVGLASPRCDVEREGLLSGIVDGFTTRGQTFLVIIRADAYSPKFGENDSVEDGTTLATTHAIVELFRDPISARAPDGSLPTDGEGPVAYHNWYIRSFRVF